MKIYGQRALAKFMRVHYDSIDRCQHQDWLNLPRKIVNIQLPGTTRKRVLTEYDTEEVVKWIEKTFN